MPALHIPEGCTVGKRTQQGTAINGPRSQAGNVIRVSITTKKSVFTPILGPRAASYDSVH
jgi:hypothetical protein